MPIRRSHSAKLILVFLAAALLSGCFAGPKKARILQRADSYFKAGDYDKAKVEYLNVLRLDNQNATAFQQVGFIWMEQGDPLRAMPFLIRLRELAPQNIPARVKLARGYQAIGQSSQARKEAASILQQDPGNGDAIVLLADASRKKEEVADAEQQLQKFPQKNSASYHLAAASIAIKKGDVETAANEVQAAITSEPNSVEAHLARGYLYLLRKDPEHSGSELKKAAELSRPRSEAQLKYAEFKASQGATDEAKTLFQNVTKQAPDYLPAWRDLAQIALAEKKYDDGLSLLENVFSRDPDNPEARIIQSQLFAGKGDPAKAVAVLDKLNTDQPNNPFVKYQLGRAYLENKNLPQAAVAFEQAIAARSDYPEAILSLAELNLSSGKTQQAVSALEDLLVKHPNLPEAQTLLVLGYRALNRLDEAVKVCREQIKKSPQPSTSYYLLGSILRQQQKNGEAREALAKALELDPDNLNALDELVTIDLAEKNYDAATQLVEQQLKKDPKSPVGHFLSAKISIARPGGADIGQAESELQKAIELDPNFTPAYDLLVSEYLSHNESAEALKQLASELEKDPNNPRPLLMTALIYEQMKDYTRAGENYEKVLAVNPNSIPAMNNLAYLYAEHLNQLDKAYELAQKARSLQPNNGIVADTLGWVLYKRGDYPQAFDLIQESANKFPDNPEVQFHLGMTSYMMGQADTARAALERALAAPQDFSGKEEAQRRLEQLQNPATASAGTTGNVKAQTNDQSQDLMALIHSADEYAQQGDAAKAAAAYEQAFKLNPKLASTAIKLGQLYAGPLHQPTKALEFARKARELAASDPKAIGTIGQIAFQTANFQYTYGLLQDSVHRGVDDPGVLQDLAMTAYFLGKVSEARSTMQHAMNANPDPDQAESAKQFLAVTATDQSSSESRAPAETEIDQILKNKPDYLPALIAKAAIQLQRGNTKAAADIYSQALEKYPDFAPAQEGLAIIYAQDPETAAKAYELAMKARKSLPDDPELARTLAELSFKRNEFPYAIQLFQESGSKQPLGATDLYYLGMAQLQSRHEAEGRKTLEQALSSGLSEPFAQEARRRLAGQPPK